MYLRIRPWWAAMLPTLRTTTLKDTFSLIKLTIKLSHELKKTEKEIKICHVGVIGVRKVTINVTYNLNGTFVSLSYNFKHANS
jgi:hypothetical protein